MKSVRTLVLVGIAGFNLSVAQTMKCVVSLGVSDLRSIEYKSPGNNVTDSFVMDTAMIYIQSKNIMHYGSAVAWDYRSPFSPTNPILLKDFDGEAIRKWGAYMVNTAGQLYDLTAESALNILTVKGIDRVLYPMCVRANLTPDRAYSLWDGSSCPPGRTILDSAFEQKALVSYGINNEGTKAIKLPSYLHSLNERRARVLDMYINEHELLCVIRQPIDDHHSQSIFLSWDIDRDRVISSLVLPYPKSYSILGVDKFGNIVLFGGLDDEYSLLFLSPEKTMLRDWDPFESVQRMEFMAGNRFLEPESGPWKYLIGYLDEDSHLFFMVKTIKGLYFLECDYLQLLKEYYGSLTPRQLLILQSMVSARRGKAFEDSALQGFFGRQAWYRQNMDYSDGKLTRNDRKFIDFISLIIEEIHPDR